MNVIFCKMNNKSAFLQEASAIKQKHFNVWQSNKRGCHWQLQLRLINYDLILINNDLSSSRPMQQINPEEQIPII